MTFFEVSLIAVGLAMDCFAVSLGIGTNGAGKKWRSILRLAFHFGLFQGGMSLLGWFLGSRIVDKIAGVDHWIAFLLLGWVGNKMIRESFCEEGDSCLEDRTRGKSLVILSVATSIDALAVGLSLAMVEVPIIGAGLMIALVSFLLSIAGSWLGNRLGSIFGRRMELAGGLILIGIGLRVLLSHLFNS